MADDAALDDWYPKSDGDTWGKLNDGLITNMSKGVYAHCEVPKTLTLAEQSGCFHDRCEYHQQCPTDSFCCLTDSHNGCEPTWDLSTDTIEGEDGWVLIFKQSVVTK